MKIKDKYIEQEDDDDKVEILNSLNFDEYEDKWDLIIEVIKDETEYDLARIEALKVIEIADVPENVIDKLCAIISNLCNNESDYDVRLYVLIASCNLINYSSDLKKNVVDILFSKHEDIDLRHNAFSAILRIENKNERDKILNLLVEDKDFSRSAKRHLSLIDINNHKI